MLLTLPLLLPGTRAIVGWLDGKETPNVHAGYYRRLVQGTHLVNLMCALFVSNIQLLVVLINTRAGWGVLVRRG